jgi:hypothetical protein
LVSVVVVVAVPGVVPVDLVVSVVVAPDGLVVVVVLVAEVVSVVGVVVVVVLLLAGGAVGAAAGVTSTLVEVLGAGVTSVLVQPTTPRAMTAARIKGDFIFGVPSAGWLFDLRPQPLQGKQSL